MEIKKGVKFHHSQYFEMLWKKRSSCCVLLKVFCLQGNQEKYNASFSVGGITALQCVISSLIDRFFSFIPRPLSVSFCFPFDVSSSRFFRHLTQIAVFLTLNAKYFGIASSCTFLCQLRFINWLKLAIFPLVLISIPFQWLSSLTCGPRKLNIPQVEWFYCYPQAVISFICFFLILRSRFFPFVFSNFRLVHGLYESLEYTLCKGWVPLTVLAIVGLTGSAVGRLFCGWACPFGMVQDFLSYLPFSKTRPDPAITKYLKGAKWAILGVHLFPLRALPPLCDPFPPQASVSSALSSLANDKTTRKRKPLQSSTAARSLSLSSTSSLLPRLFSLTCRFLSPGSHMPLSTPASSLSSSSPFSFSPSSLPYIFPGSSAAIFALSGHFWVPLGPLNSSPSLAARRCRAILSTKHSKTFVQWELSPRRYILTFFFSCVPVVFSFLFLSKVFVLSPFFFLNRLSQENIINSWDCIHCGKCVSEFPNDLRQTF